jgi:hypothetical protein
VSSWKLAVGGWWLVVGGWQEGLSYGFHIAALWGKYHQYENFFLLTAHCSLMDLI